MAQHNADRPDWNGQSGERWIVHQAQLDARLAVFGEAAIEATAAAGERVLDVGCGAGSSSLALAARVGAGGQVLGLDISEPLIARARALAPQDMPVVFRVADACSAELPEGAFDILFSRFGVMFFGDPTGAFAHMRRRAQAGRAGRFRLLARRGRERLDAPADGRDQRHRRAPTAPPDPEAPGPFSFGDPKRVGRILTAAGFTNIAIEPFDALAPFGVGAARDAAIDDAVKMAIEVGPLSRVLADQPDDIRARASAAVRAAFAGRPGERSLMIESATWIVTARNPAS